MLQLSSKILQDSRNLESVRQRSFQNVNVSENLLHVSDASGSAVSFDPSRWHSTFESQLTLDELGLSLDDSSEVNVGWNDD